MMGQGGNVFKVPETLVLCAGVLNQYFIECTYESSIPQRDLNWFVSNCQA